MFVAGTWFRKKAFVATVTKAVKHGRRWKREKHGRRWERDSRALRRVHSTASRRTKSYPESTRETMGSSPQFLGQRTVYAIFGIPGIPSSVAATEEKARFAFKEYTSRFRIMKPMLGMSSAVVQISAWTLTRGCDELSCVRPIWQASTVTINDYVTH